MLSHATAHDWLIPYADGMLAADERQRVDGHIVGCASCAGELREVRELNLLLVSLPPAPPVSFAPFWLKLQAVLPQRRSFRVRSIISYRRAGLAFALAGLTLFAMAGTALAAPAAMPDSVLYPLKQLEEGIQLATAPASARLGVQIQQASERLREAQVMAANHKTVLAAESLKAFRVTLNGATAALKKADPTAAKKDVDRLRAGLAAVERENALRDDDDSYVRQLVTSAANDLDQIYDPAVAPTSSLVIGIEASPDPTPAPKPTVKATAQPEPTEKDGGHHH
jgi:hypothetical protein